jgi:HEAT repeat protein
MALKTANQDLLKPDQERRIADRDFTQLKIQLSSLTPSERRWAARDLAFFDNSAPLLISALTTESEPQVIEGILSSLQQLPNNDTVTGLIALLSSEDASKRNGAIEVLQTMPDLMDAPIQLLLQDSDSDVRIFAMDILQQLAHPNTPQWLKQVLEEESHVNVVAAAIDRLAEVATVDIEPLLHNVQRRFADHEYIQFAAGIALTRLAGGVHG